MKKGAFLTWSDGRVSSKQMQPPATQTEMFDNVEDLHRLLHISHLRLLSDDQVNVYVCMDEVTVGTSAHCSFDSH